MTVSYQSVGKPVQRVRCEGRSSWYLDNSRSQLVDESTEGRLKVTVSHIHCKYGTVSQIVQGRNVFTTDH